VLIGIDGGVGIFGHLNIRLRFENIDQEHIVDENSLLAVDSQPSKNG
jgi:hypothetical protein